MPRSGDAQAIAAPWLVDRLFRNMLVDVTGNTHRAEICIDKLFSPDGPTGRLGLVEFRSFEMPPDARMSLAQQLLLRALVAWFWREPLDGTLVRWGTALHDRFMLEHFVWQDFLDVLDDLNRAGYRFDPVWFEAQREFRFPLYGSGRSRRRASSNCVTRSSPGMCWARKARAGGTARFVDSSVERLQVKVEGFNAGRHVVTCNGRRMPLTSTGRAGRISSPACASRPGNCRRRCTRPSTVQAPLTFDIVDTWSRRSLGGCVYHVAHPGGRNYETFPVNSYEAEAVGSRAFRITATRPGCRSRCRPRNARIEYPATLDLRRPSSRPSI